MFMSPATMAEPMNTPLEMVTWVGRRNHVLDGVEISERKGQFLGESGGPS